MKLVEVKCPNCAAKVSVEDVNKIIICEYCRTQIFLDSTPENLKVEFSEEIEIKNLPKLTNLIKLANRYYENKEYQEAYFTYQKILELDPDIPMVYIRSTLSKILVVDYKNVDVIPIITVFNNTLKMVKTNEYIMNIVIEITSKIEKIVNENDKFIKNNRLNLVQMESSINILNSSLLVYETLIEKIYFNEDLKLDLVNKSINIMKGIYFHYFYYEGGKAKRYKCSKEFRKRYNAKLKEYTEFKNKLDGKNTKNKKITVDNRKLISLLLCLFLGVFGAHKFYEGKIGLGILYFCTCGLFFIGVIVDFINIIRDL